MKFSLSWLKQHLQTSATADEIASTLNNIGIEVEGIEDIGATIAHITVAKVLKAEKHPNADRLKVCQVETNQGVVELVCGAPNARDGLVTAFVAPGQVVPKSGQALKKSVIRDVESHGMLCSATELCLSEESNGTIIELDPTLKVGSSLAEALGMNDVVFTVAVTPNRSDCLSVRGIARDLAAVGIGSLTQNIYPMHTPSTPSSIQIELMPEAALDCPFFMGRMIEGVENRPSPDWLKHKLQSIGLKPISALVDITNYVLFDIGRPLHAFDANKIDGNIVIRHARADEEILALNGKSYTLEPSMLTISDSKKALSIAGIMGSENSACQMDTTRIFLESAYFNFECIARTGRALNINSDARYRFERGVDPARVQKGLNMATKLILEICGGQASAIVTAGIEPKQQFTARLSRHRIMQYAGIDIPTAPLILEKLGFTFEPKTTPIWSQNNKPDSSQSSDVLEVIAPSWRHDIRIEEDLIEEVLRIHGFDRIPDEPLPYKPIPKLKPSKSSIVRRTLATQHLVEAVTWSFLNEEAAQIFGADIQSLTLINPISSELNVMRPSLLPNLLQASQKNLDRGLDQVNLFEVGATYHGTLPEQQISMAAGVRTGPSQVLHWSSKSKDVDIFDVKGDILAVAENMGINPSSLRYSTDNLPPWYHPARSSSIISTQNKIIGYFGELHPRVQRQMGLKKPHVIFEIFLEHLPPFCIKAPRSPLSLNPLMPVERDFAFIMDQKVSAENLTKAVKKADRRISNVTIFDIFEGKGIDPGTKSIALRVMLQPHEATFTDADIQAISQAIIQNVDKFCQGKLRG
ncbi:MAG: phenylalanine--tRNA ligase subunit beta [Alphaproteobacteria bacterium]|nr:phenylalanine--tRNA ligase subunit beta [Alphaproteobacteria bacterium]OJV46460.1 MAG: phenylalanine--tRNA ligase subunit beta [Alphaproteobacteria bacterium 43-37]